MTIRIEASVDLRIIDGQGQGTRLADVVPLLNRLTELGSIAGAADALGLSYRHAWGLLRDVEARLGAPLLERSRGRGSKLSALGEKLVWADAIRTERLAGPLQGLAGEVSDELNRLLTGASNAVRISASHGYAVAALVSAMAARNAPVDIKYRDSVDAIVSLARGECDLAGFHLPIGEFRGTCAAPYRPFLDDERHMLIHLSRRKQGLFLKRGNPKRIVGLTDLARGDIRFVNRQPGSGTRILLDLALRKVGVDPGKVNGYASTELTHSAIAAFVASGMADVGFGVEPAASQFGLDFVPVVTEDYYFACERTRLNDVPLVTLLEVLRDASFKASVDRLAGYDPVECGTTLDVASGLAGSSAQESYPR